MERIKAILCRAMSQRTIAVLGMGSAGRRHLAALSGLAGIRALATPARLANGLKDAVTRGAGSCVIASDTRRHVPDALAALALGLDALVEKPLAPDARSASKLLKASARARRRIYVGCVLRFSASLARLRRELPRIGAVHAVTVECRSYLPDWRPDRPYRDTYSARPGEGGVLLDLIHEIDYVCWLFGWPKAVEGRLRNLGRLGIRVEEAAELRWETSAGCAISLSLDYLTRTPRRRLVAFGSLGTLEWDALKGTVTASFPGRKTRVSRDPETRDRLFRAQARAFLARRSARDPRLATAEEGVRALSVCDAARRSSRSGRREAVRSPA